MSASEANGERLKTLVPFKKKRKHLTYSTPFKAILGAGFNF